MSPQPAANEPWIAPIHTVLTAVESTWDHLYRTVGPGRNRLSIIPYLGHGNRNRVVVRGRVLADHPGRPTDGVERLGKRVERMIRRFVTTEVGGVELLVTVGDGHGRGTTGEDGYFTIAVDDHDLAMDRVLHPVKIDVIGVDTTVRIEVGAAHVMVPTNKARRLVISDVDDTVLHSEATDTGRLVLNTITGSAWTRRGYPGTATLYEGLQRGPGLDEDNPFAYVSSSPWNLYDFLTSFLRRAGLPTGPLFLRDMGFDGGRFGRGGHGEHKGAAIAELLEVHDLPVVLVGDTGQHDAEIYHQIALDHPGRVEAVLLRHVADDARQSDVEQLYADTGVPVAVSNSTATLARIAERAGLIGPGWADRVAADL